MWTIKKQQYWHHKWASQYEYGKGPDIGTFSNAIGSRIRNELITVLAIL
jgi:hypothetical protein